MKRYSRERITLYMCVFRPVLSFRAENDCGIHTSATNQQINWFWQITLHEKAHNLHVCNIIFTSPQVWDWSWNQSMIHILASPILSFSDHCVNSRESKYFKIILLCWSVRSYLLTHFTHLISYLPSGKSAIRTPVHATNLPHAVYQILFTDFDVPYERVNT